VLPTVNNGSDNNIVTFVKSTAPRDPVVCAPLPWRCCWFGAGRCELWITLKKCHLESIFCSHHHKPSPTPAPMQCSAH